MNYIGPCNHPESSLSGSTVQSMIDKHKELGVPYFACTDNGSLISTLKGYTYAEQQGIKFIAGTEIYFKDSNCDIIKNTASEQIKYFKLIIHAKDQQGYQELVRQISDNNKPKVWVSNNAYPLFSWKDLEQLSKFSFTVSTSDVECMVSKHLLVDRADLGLKYYERIRNIFGEENFFPTILPFKQDKYWNAMVHIELASGKKVLIPAFDRVETDHYSKAKAFELTKKGNRHRELKAVFINKVRFIVEAQHREIIKAKLVNEFVELPSDLQTKANNFILALADKFGDTERMLINNYAYYSNKEDKVVQDMKLGETSRVYQPQFINSTEGAAKYLQSELKLSLDKTQDIVKNSYSWAHQFDNFKLEYSYQLPQPDGKPEKLLIDTINKVGRMDWKNPIYVKQFREEFELLTNNGVINLIPYFLPIVDVYDFYSESGYLTGPGRGSAGGFLISYLLGVTHIDPIKYELSSSRFLTMDRVKQGNLPDIDCDLENRIPLVGRDGNSGYLFKKYGKKAAQVSTRTLLRIKSAILDANRFINGGRVENEVAALSKSLPNTPQGINDNDFVFGYEDSDGNHVPGLIELNDELQKYAVDRPKEWDIVTKALSLSRQHSRHACFAAGTLIDSKYGVTRIENNPKFTSSNLFLNTPIETKYSGFRDTIIISMNNGVSIQCTPDHRMIVNNQEVEAKDLLGKEVSYKAFNNTIGNENISKDLAFSLGWFLNDGTYIQSTVDRFEFYFTPKKDDQPKCRILDYLKRNGHRVTQAKDRADTYRTYHLDDKFKIKNNTPNKRLPDFFWKMSLSSQCAFMRGLFSANGYCLTTRPTVAIKLTSKLLISDIAIWLHSIGIHTSCSYTKPKHTEHHNGTFISRSTGNLTIPHYSNKKKFQQLVGFEQTYKSERLAEIIDNAINTNYFPQSVKCVKIEPSEYTEVWDFHEPITNMGYINGILAHNCAFIVSDKDIEETIPIFEVGGVKRVTQPEAKQCEWAGLIKYDFLVVSALQDINLCLKYINKRNNEEKPTGYFSHKGAHTYVWDLPEERDVFNMLSDGHTESVFQLNTVSVTPFVKRIKPESILDCATITSLVRPGPLDFTDEETGRNMAEEYIYRRNGLSKGKIEILNELIPETYGILVFQEQVSKIAKELGKMSVEDAENVRIGMGKKKIKLLNSLKPKFIEGAAKTVGQDIAENVWSMMATFARYGFNKSHATAYSVISYTCAFLKYHYNLEWWAAVLSNADTKEINEVFYKYVKDMVLPPDINTSTEEMEVDYNLGKIRNKLSMISGLGTKAAEKIIKLRPYIDIEDFVSKKPCGPSMTKKLIHIGVLNSLFYNSDGLMQKMYKYEQAYNAVLYKEKLIEYDEKIKEAAAAGDGKKAEKLAKNKERYEIKGIREPQIDTSYIGLGPKQDFLIKKSVFPTMNLDLQAVLDKDSKTLIVRYGNKRVITNSYGRDNVLVNGETLQQIDSKDLTDDAYFCVPGYVMSCEKFTYQGGARTALKMIIDSSGYISEKVLWPDYNTGELVYPEELKKGAIVYFFYSKKAGKPYTNIKEVIIEEKSIL